MISPYITDSLIESAVGLIVVAAGQRRNAMTLSFFSEVAHHPTTLWVSVAQTAYTHSLIEEAGQFSLIVLNQTQKKIALACGTISGRDRDKCAALNLYRNPEGFLFLDQALASTACRVRHSVPIGEHTLFVADILEAELDSRTGHLRQLLLSDL